MGTIAKKSLTVEPKSMVNYKQNNNTFILVQLAPLTEILLSNYELEKCNFGQNFTKTLDVMVVHLEFPKLFFSFQVMMVGWLIHV